MGRYGVARPWSGTTELDHGRGSMMFKSRMPVAGLTAIALACTTGALRAQGVAREGHLFGMDAAVPGSAFSATGECLHQLDPSGLSGEPDPVSRSPAFRPPTIPTTQERGSPSRILRSAGIGLVAGFALGWTLDHTVKKSVTCVGTSEVFYGCDATIPNMRYFYRVTIGALGTVSGALVGWLRWTSREAPH